MSWSEQVFRAASTVLLVEVKAAAPIGQGEQGGETQDKVNLVPESSPPVFSARIVSPTPQSDWTEYGTSPHLILPHGNVLVFEVGGQTVFAKVVHHPGNAAKPWFFPTIEAGYLPALYEAAGQFN